MLETLRDIIHEVNSAADLSTALNIAVQRIRRGMNTQVCTVYLVNEHCSRYVVAATSGLNEQAVGHSFQNVSQGLVGLVGLREEPINLENVADHPSFLPLSDTGDDRYCAFLGMPLIHQRRLLGVIALQRSECHKFSELEESLLVTLCTQLAGSVAHFQATMGMPFELPEPDDEAAANTACFHGTSGAVGACIGEAVVVMPPVDFQDIPDHGYECAEHELKQLENAINAVSSDIVSAAEQLAGRLPEEEQALFDVYLKVLSDNTFLNDIRRRIRDGLWVQAALKKVVEEYVSIFENMEDDYCKERVTDIKDIGCRILSYLQKNEYERIAYKPNTVLISEELSAAMLGEVPKEALVGLISTTGSGNSHVAILARALGVPTVMGAVDMPLAKIADQPIIVDGSLGHVYVAPSPSLVNYYQRIIAGDLQFQKKLDAIRDQPAITKDHCPLSLWINTGLSSDFTGLLDEGAAGVGLYRTELPFMLSDCFPSGAEQEALYRKQLLAFSPRPVTMRTLDIGGDKSLSYFPIHEANPFLGWRGIRVTLDHPELFLVQIKAMLKASVGLNNLRIMLPMVTTVAEVDEALTLITRAYNELSAEVPIVMPKIGVMIEVPAAVYITRAIAKRVDFISVGSNDLVQYLLAVDRNNPRVSNLYHCCHPAVLQALSSVVEGCKLEGRPVSICGEMAGNPATAILLLAMGFNALSMSAVSLLRVKWILRHISRAHAKAILEEVLTYDNATAVYQALQSRLYNDGLGEALGLSQPPTVETTSYCPNSVTSNG